MSLATCNRCGKENVDVHTCTPSKAYRKAYKEALEQVLTEIRWTEKEFHKHETSALKMQGALAALATLETTISALSDQWGDK